MLLPGGCVMTWLVRWSSSPFTWASGWACTGRSLLTGRRPRRSWPVDALRAARGLLRQSGSLILADELVEDEFTAPASELERYHYGWSVVACLPAAMGDPRTAATGEIGRPSGRE